jgi:2-C-methyl-D-erythritol 4-phosphate cytidylyltransferase
LKCRQIIIFVFSNFIIMDRNQQMWAIIVAGGSGSRMQAEVPKQFLELCGKPILMHSIEVFAGEGIRVIVVLPSSQIEYWKELCSRYGFTLPHDIAEGGATRFHSVKNGLSALPGKGLVAIHDGVRPLVSRQTVAGCFREAADYGCAVPAVPVIDSVREVSGLTNRMLDRSALRLIQTPQVFDIALLKKAYEQEYTPAFTDDASVFEKAGHTIRLTEGNAENIKITTPNDLVVAETLITYISHKLTF